MAQSRFCSAACPHTFVDLGMSLLSANYLTAQQPNRFYPLRVPQL